MAGIRDNILDAVGTDSPRSIEQAREGAQGDADGQGGVPQPRRSVKDRVAVKMIERRRRKGLLKPGGRDRRGHGGQHGRRSRGGGGDHEAIDASSCCPTR